MVAPESTHERRRQFSKKVLGTARTTDYQLNMLGADGSHVPIEVSSVASREPTTGSSGSSG